MNEKNILIMGFIWLCAYMNEILAKILLAVTWFTWWLEIRAQMTLWSMITIFFNQLWYLTKTHYHLKGFKYFLTSACKSQKCLQDMKLLDHGKTPKILISYLPSVTPLSMLQIQNKCILILFLHIHAHFLLYGIKWVYRYCTCDNKQVIVCYCGISMQIYNTVEYNIMQLK